MCVGTAMNISGELCVGRLRPEAGRFELGTEPVGNPGCAKHHGIFRVLNCHRHMRAHVPPRARHTNEQAAETNIWRFARQDQQHNKTRVNARWRLKRPKAGGPIRWHI